MQPKKILDVGTNNTGLYPFFDKDKCVIYCLDIEKPNNIENNYNFFQGDGSWLPFKDKCFDCVCSIAVLPQIPKNKRTKFLSELKRVGKNVVVYTEAVQGKKGEFKGLDWEISFHQNVIKRYGRSPHSLEKIKRRKVDLDEIKSLSNNYYGFQNYDTTYKYWSLIYHPIARYFAGLMYYIFWRKYDRKPPFKDCIILLEK